MNIQFVFFKSKVHRVLFAGVLCLQTVLLFPQMGTAQKKAVSGTVTDKSSGAALQGVTVQVKGTALGTTTDSKGRYAIEGVALADSLIFSYVGYQPQTVSIGDKGTLNIQMETAILQGKQVVIVGYGQQQQQHVTEAITTISSDQLNQPSVSSFDHMLQGKVPGVQVNPTSGAPGGNVNIMVRGIHSITGDNQPLYVIDGFPVGTGGTSDMRGFGGSTYSASGISDVSRRSVLNPLSLIDPSDIESISILKDAAATAIYGSRGSNGVVIITTKRGAEGKARINVDVSYGLQEVAHPLDMFNAQQYAAFVASARDNAWVFSGGSADDPNAVRSAATYVRPSFRKPETITTNTDWQDVIFRVAPIQRIHLSATGGMGKTNYLVSGGYYSEDGTILTSHYKRFNLRINLNTALTDRLKLGTSTYGSYEQNRLPNVSGHYGTGGVLSAALAASPTIPVYDKNGDPYFDNQDVIDGLGWLANPLVDLYGYSNTSRKMNIISNNFLEYTITPDLTFKTTLGVHLGASTVRIWRSSKLPNYTSLNYPANAGVTKADGVNWLNENTLNYHTSWAGGDHMLNAVAGFMEQKNSSNAMSAGAANFPTDNIPYLSGGIVNDGTQVIGEWSLLSLLARVNYSFKNKYLFTAAIRRDGSSKFGSDRKWGTFPSVSAGYNISNERFLTDSKVVSNLKLTASYGVAGNNQIGDYTHLGIIGFNKYIQGGAAVPGAYPASLPNNSLAWEKTDQLNLGLHLGLFSDRIALDGNLYKSLTKDLLLNVPLPAASGFTGSVQNIGTVENKGVELGINTININNTTLKWTTAITFSANKNKVLKLNNNGNQIANSEYQITKVGLPIASFYLLHKVGIFKDAAAVSNAALYNPKTQAGDIQFEDVNQDGNIDQDDRKIIGSPWPDFTWGIDNSFSFKNFTLDISIVGSQGAYLYFQAGTIVLNSAGVQNQMALSADRWRPDHVNAKFPRAIRNNYANGFGTSTNFLFDASFVRINNVHLRYDFPEHLLSRMKMNGLQLYISVANLHTFTDYPGYNPESSDAGGNIAAAGTDYLSYPLSRKFTFGIKLAL